MSRSAKTSALFVMAAVCFPSAVMPAEQRPAVFTTGELQQRLLKANARVHAWYVEYESARQLASGVPTESYVHRIVAAKAPDYYFHWTTHGTASYDWRNDPNQQRFTLAPSGAVIERPFHRQFRYLSLAADAPLPGTMRQEFLFLAMGWWPFPKRPSPPCLLPAVARSRNYVANPWQELVQGRWCHILEHPDHDRLWLDCDHGCVILRRELFDPKNRLLSQRIESSEHREIQPGIWVPFVFRNMLFVANRAQPQEAKAAKTLDATLKVREARLNEHVSDNIFRFEPLPGSIQSIGDGQDDRIEQVVPGGADYLEELIDWVQHQFAFSGIPTRDSGSDREAVLEYSAIGGGIIVFIACLLCRCLRGKKEPGNIEPTRDLATSKPIQI